MIGLTKLCQMIKLSSLLTCGDVVYFKAYTVYIYIHVHLRQVFYGNRLNIEEEIQNKRS